MEKLVLEEVDISLEAYNFRGPSIHVLSILAQTVYQNNKQTQVLTAIVSD